MTPEIMDLEEFIVVGVRVVLDMDAETTGTLWKDRFLPRRNEIPGAEHRYYCVFNSLPDTGRPGRYEYVAGVAGTLENIPEGMVGWVMPAGRFVAVRVVGLAGISQACRRLTADWLPDSGYRRVDSPIFASTRDERPDSSGAEWEVCVPVETPEELEKLRHWQV